MKHKAYRAAKKYGYRSGLEHKVSLYLDERNINYEYECMKIEWEDLAYRTYTPDFILDIRFVFTSSKSKLRKGAKSTYGEWCEKHGFRCYDRIIPEDWLKEKGKNKHGTFIKFNGTKVKRR